jgi:hypothetical protein
MLILSQEKISKRDTLCLTANIGVTGTVYHYSAQYVHITTDNGHDVKIPKSIIVPCTPQQMDTLRSGKKLTHRQWMFFMDKEDSKTSPEESIYKGDFVWELIDSSQLSKEQMHSLTKEFIAKKWKSAQNVIQNDDKELGNIIVKGTVKLEKMMMTQVLTYHFTHTIDFRFKENKFKINISDVECSSATTSSYAYTPGLMPVFEPNNPPENYSAFKYNLTRSQAVELMKELKADLSNIALNYKAFLATAKDNSDW